MMNNELTMRDILVEVLENEDGYYVDLVQRRLNKYLDDTNELWYVNNDDENIDMIADSRRIYTKDLLVLAINNDYEPEADYVNSDLVTINANELAQLYIDNIEDILELLSAEDINDIVNEYADLARDIDSISYYITGPEEEIDSLISMAEDIVINRILVDYEETINEEVNGAEILYDASDACLYVIKEADEDKLMKVRKEVSEYATWIKYYYPDGEEELVYHKKN